MTLLDKSSENSKNKLKPYFNTNTQPITDFENYLSSQSPSYYLNYGHHQLILLTESQSLDQDNTLKKKYRNEYYSSIKSSQKILTKVLTDTNLNDKISENHSLIVPIRYREQAYFRLGIPVEPNFYPLYMYGWLSSRKDFNDFSQQSNNIKEIVLASCLFGTAIVGVSAEKRKIPLINHKIQIPSIINQIDVKKLFHPYEILAFSNFSMICRFASFFPDKPKLRYHLPTIEYILFGVRLYLEKKMTQNALRAYIAAVKKRSKRHNSILSKIASHFNIEISIESAFDNLFDNLDKKRPDEIMNFFIQHIDIAAADSQLQLVNFLFSQLSSNSYVKDHQIVWSTLKNKYYGTFDTIEDFLKFSNAVILAFAAHEKKDYEVCSLLPLDEKPIAKKYADDLESIFKKLIYLTFIFSTQYQKPEDENKLFNFNIFESNTEETKNIKELILNSHFVSNDIKSIITEKSKLKNFCLNHTSKFNLSKLTK